MTGAGGFYEELAQAATKSNSSTLDVIAAILRHQGSNEDFRVNGVGPHIATLVNPAGRAIHVLSVQGHAAELGKAVAHLAEMNPREGTEVVVYGGGEAEAEAISAAVPQLLMHPFVVFHRSADGQVRSWPPKRAGRSRRARALEHVQRLTSREREELNQLIAHHAEYFSQQVRERKRFFQTIDGRRTWSTNALLGAIVFMFALQLRWWPRTGSESTVADYVLALGALNGTLVAQGEWFRLISVGFLHGDFIHLGMNGFALFLLGGQMERTLGTARFLVLYVFSLVGASLASSVFTELSVGASGAIWGLLGAQVVLAYRVPPILPESVAARMKPLVLANLLINAVFSFAPFIDTAAHFGGGAAGAALIASRVLYRHSERNSPSGRSGRTRRGTPDWVTVAAVLAVALLIVGLGAALIRGRPWTFGGLS